MKQAYHKSDTDLVTIGVLTAISQVSTRMVRNLKILAATDNPRKEKESMGKMNDMAMTI
ncbi:hypothetical protein MKA58_06505 [[Clostridium] innocuum]|nr:hypothetical protein [[Clostridium] innocuum]